MEGPRRPPLLGLLLRVASWHWGMEVDAALRAAGFDDIRAPHANVFPFVPPEGIRASHLARLARVRRQTMQQTVEELERAGYVERRPDPRDRRSRLVFLTPRGRAVQEIGARAAGQVEERWARLTSREHIEELRQALERLLEKLYESNR
ncbi:MAG TPA: MarR family winged helix-turn-helix transcriptional regulator [Candidatus Dormibacteraeota bacterium]|jgi:DNA-binding MarR family transcriptional regulator|nr:MarR family winged helix-turn-helix transcriptional regulator [Candidatus Dormibacteraeota bacterium]